MIRGVLIAVILLAAGDLCFNHGQVVRHLGAKVTAFGTDSSDAVKGSIFNR